MNWVPMLSSLSSAGLVFVFLELSHYQLSQYKLSVSVSLTISLITKYRPITPLVLLSPCSLQTPCWKWRWRTFPAILIFSITKAYFMWMYLTPRKIFSVLGHVQRHLCTLLLVKTASSSTRYSSGGWGVLKTCCTFGESMHSEQTTDVFPAICLKSYQRFCSLQHFCYVHWLIDDKVGFIIIIPLNRLIVDALDNLLVFPRQVKDWAVWHHDVFVILILTWYTDKPTIK